MYFGGFLRRSNYNRKKLRPEKKVQSSGHRWRHLGGGSSLVAVRPWRCQDYYLCAIVRTTRKKRYICLSGGCTIIITTGKKILVVCLAGEQSLLRPEKKKIQLSVCWVRNHYYDWKKKVLVICLAGARSLLLPKKKKFMSSVWRVRDWYYNRKKLF